MSLSEILRLDPESVIESRPVILPGNSGRQFDQLRGGEVLLKFVKEFVGNFDRRERDGIRVAEHQLLQFRK